MAPQLLDTYIVVDKSSGISPASYIMNNNIVLSVGRVLRASFLCSCTVLSLFMLGSQYQQPEPGKSPHLANPRAVPEVLAASDEASIRARINETCDKLPMSFEANDGQTDPTVAYYARTFAGIVFVTQDGRIVYSLPGGKASASSRTRSPDRKDGWSLTETVVGGRARPSGTDRAATHVSYFTGNDPARWRSGLPTFEGVFLGEVWPGISLELRAHGKNVEKLFTVEPGADPSRIQMSVAGARSLRVNAAGALVVGTGLGEVTFTQPAAFQERDGERHPVEVAYELRGRNYGFRLADYDPALPVMIDPLLQATYLGGSGGYDQAFALAVHPATGDVYVAGVTNSTNFPGTVGGAQAAHAIDGGNTDAFVARLNAALTTLIQATYLGGNGYDFITSLAIHPTSGDVYVAGQTLSTNFPGTAGGAQAANGGGSDAFVADLNAALTTLNQATYLGGNSADGASALAINPTTGDVYVAGGTFSDGTCCVGFPGTAGGAQPAKALDGTSDGFVARLNSALTTLNQATYLGGIGYDQVFALAIHPTSGDVYVAGNTEATDFPGTSGGAQTANGGGSDAFVARLSADLTTLTQATYLGGGDRDEAFALAIHPTTGDVYVAGQTLSTNFPGTGGGAQAAYGGGSNDAFVARLNAALTTLTQATYLGGSNFDIAQALAIHPTSGNVYVAGQTASLDFPGTAGGSQHANDGGYSDAFVADLNSALTTLNQATYLGGSGSGPDIAYALAIHPTSGNVYVAGQTYSTDFPGTSGGAQPANAGPGNAFVAYLSPDLASAVGTIGYWLNHPKAWCESTITLGCTTYTEKQAIAILKQPINQDMTYQLAAQLIAAKLNVLCAGTNPSCVSSAITSADAWLCLHPIGSKVKANSSAWKTITPTYNTLASYNEGLLCAPPRD